MRVLLADDDREQLSIRAMLLRHHGFESIEVHGREAALEAAAHQCPDCAVIDLGLPTVAAGLETIRELKRLRSNMPIFVLTGYTIDQATRHAALELAEEVIVKGAGSAYLLERLRAVS